jgi:hypothetical protein
LSVDISNWNAPGILYGKSAKRCSPREVLAQIRQHHTAAQSLPDGIVDSWFLDPGVRWHPKLGRNTNATPLLVNTVDSWRKRPTAVTGIPNLLMTGDFVRTDIDLATMEGANESARTATYRLYDPPEFRLLKQADARLYKAGLPNALDVG